MSCQCISLARRTGVTDGVGESVRPFSWMGVAFTVGDRHIIRSSSQCIYQKVRQTAKQPKGISKGDKLENVNIRKDREGGKFSSLSLPCIWRMKSINFWLVFMLKIFWVTNDFEHWKFQECLNYFVWKRCARNGFWCLSLIARQAESQAKVPRINAVNELWIFNCALSQIREGI